jgi:hypothetical protein
MDVPQSPSPTLLRVLATQRHWQTYRVFAERFATTADQLAQQERSPSLAGLTVSERQYERWFSGAVRTRPYPDQCRVLEGMFDTPVDQLLAPAHQSTGPAATTADLQRPTDSVILGREAQDTTDSLERRIAMAARRAQRFSAMAEGSAVGPETLAQLGEDIVRLATAYPRLPLPALLGDLVAVQDLTFQLLEGGHIRPGQARELYLYAAIASGMLAKASHDLGDPRAALMQARTAYVCADNADHHPMRAWVRGLQSLITYWDGRTEEAANYARLGTELAGSVNGTAKVWLACLEARAHAALGDAQSTADAIVRADVARNVSEPDDLDTIGGILTFPRPRQLYYVAEAQVALHDDGSDVGGLAAAAVEAYRTAQEEEWAFGDEAGAHTNLALARISAGELEGGADAVRPVLDLPVDQRNHGIVVSARRVHTALCASPHRAAAPAREAREEIEAFVGTTTATVVRR